MKVFDLHCDTAFRMLDENKTIYNRELQVSVDKCLAFDKFVQVYAIWVDSKRTSDCKKYAENMINNFKKEISDNKFISEYNTNENNKLSYILSIEGGEAFGDDPDNVTHFNNMGVKIITPVWNNKNNIGTPSIIDDTSGITPFGIKVTRKANEKKMVVDLSHINIKGFFDLVEIADRPIVSHSNSYKVCNNKRNITDEQFYTIKHKNGLVGINYYPYFLNNSDKADVNDIIRHIYHFLSLGGENVICIGSDFDGIDCFPTDFQDVNGHLILAEEMLKINFSEKIIANLFYNNCKKYFKNHKI